MNKNIIIDNRMREIEKEKLKQLGYNILEIQTSKNVYEEISSHVDIFCCKIENEIVAENNCYNYLKNKIDENILISGNAKVRY